MGKNKDTVNNKEKDNSTTVSGSGNNTMNITTVPDMPKKEQYSSDLKNMEKRNQ